MCFMVGSSGSPFLFPIGLPTTQNWAKRKRYNYIMDKKFIIQKGDTPKYQITITHPDFDMVRDNFYLILAFGMSDKSLTIQKSEMFFDEDNSCFFMFSSANMTGLVTAACHYFVPDSDMTDGYREEVDYQYIGFSTDDPCPSLACDTCSQQEDAHVSYDRVWRNDVNTLYLNVRTADGEAVMTSEGEQVRVHKTEDELY